MGPKRRLKAEARLAAIESAYVAVLKPALVASAAGRWGLFRQNAHIKGADRYHPGAVDELEALAAEVNELRGALGYGPFPLHARFSALQGRDDENQPGEPRLAAMLLSELDALTG